MDAIYIVVYVMVALVGLCFGYLGYVTGRSRKFTWEVWFAAGIALVAAVVPLLAPAHDWTFLPICGPWLTGIAAGKWRARAARHALDSSSDSDSKNSSK